MGGCEGWARSLFSECKGWGQAKDGIKYGVGSGQPLHSRAGLTVTLARHKRVKGIP